MKRRSATIRDNLPTAVFPVEKVERELDSKLIMASALAARGYRAIVGHLAEIRFIGRNSGPLIWQGKDLIANRFSYSSENHHADHVLRNGTAIMYIHDEGGMFQVNSFREQLLGKHQVEALRQRAISRLCTWGQKQQAIISEHAPELASRIRVTGSPRFDICSPRFGWLGQSIVQENQDRMSPYILACTRFGSVASRKGIHHMFQIKLDLKRWPSESSMKGVADIWFTKWRQDVHDFAEFVILVKELALMQPAYRIVLRPHDNESLLFYEQAFSPYKNVEVIREGNVLNWIRGAELVLHSNCTTGIEAVLAGRPVLNFLPGDRDRSALDVEVAREAGTIARSVTESLETAGALLSGKGQAQNWSPHALSILNNLERQAIPLLVSETLAVTQEHGITGSKLVLPPQPAARNFARRMAGRPKLKLSACWGSKPGMLELDHVEMILEGYRAMGDGGGHIREFSSQYVIIDP